MSENLRAAFERYGNLTVRDLALEVAFSGLSWSEVCRRAERISGAKPGVYGRLKARLAPGQTLNSLIADAFDGGAE